MKTRTILITILLSSLLGNSLSHAQGTTFTYQGRLSDNPEGWGANGNHDLHFTLYDAATHGNAVSAAVTNATTSVSNGFFIVALDFGAVAFNGADRWLEIGVRTNGSSEAYQILSPRQSLTAAPYAVRAANFSGALSDGQLSANVARLNANQTFSGSVNFSNVGGVFNGSFIGNGAGLTGLNATNLTGSVPSVSLTSVPAESLTGTVADGRLSANVARLTADQTFGGSVIFSNARGVFTGNFNGNGIGLTNADIGRLSSGALIWGKFVVASSPSVGATPQTAAAADVNGDGKMDLICANTTGGTLSVLTNNGSGGFALASSPPIGIGPTTVVAADVNGDGKPDLACTAWDHDRVVVLTNDGGGGFVLASSTRAGMGCFVVTAADVNGDGKVDLITANNLANTLSVLTNNGSGGFVIASSPDAGYRPVSLTAADVNGDGKMDMICANYFDNKLTVLTNSGTGAFVLASSPGVGMTPTGLAAADVNGDGKVDLINANFNDNTLSVLTNDGGGGFVLATSPKVGNGPCCLTAADVNGDEKVDLICSNYGSGFGDTLSVLTNDGSGGFVLANSLVVGHGAFGVIAADLNGDGKPDLASVNEADNKLTVLFNTPTFIGSFSGNGEGLTGLSATNLIGTIADGRLSGNVALRTGGNALSGDQTVMAGNVGIGTTTPGFLLEVNGSAGKPGGGSWSTSSDARLKKNIHPLTGALDKLLALHGVNFEYIEPAKIHELSGERMGLVAQEVEKVFPDWVEIGPNGYKRVTVRGLEALVVEALREQQAQINEKDRELRHLAQRLEALEKTIGKGK